jgi:hypothetical protein
MKWVVWAEIGCASASFKVLKGVGNHSPENIATIIGSTFCEAHQIPALAVASPGHRAIVLVHDASISVGSRFRMGENIDDGDI